MRYNDETNELVRQCQTASGYPTWHLTHDTSPPHIYLRIPPGRGSGSKPGTEKYALDEARDIMQQAQLKMPFPVRADLIFETRNVNQKLEARMDISSANILLLEKAVAHLTGPMKHDLQRAVHDLVMNARPCTCAFNLAVMNKTLSAQNTVIADSLRAYELNEQQAAEIRRRFRTSPPYKIRAKLERIRKASAAYAVLAPYLEKHDSGNVRDVLNDPETPELIKTTITRAVPAFMSPENRI